MSESREGGRPSYPRILDVVDYGGNEYQVIGFVQTGNYRRDIFILKDIATGIITRVVSAVFSPQTTRTPGAGDVYRRDEGVRVTGLIEGGEIEE